MTASISFPRYLLPSLPLWRTGKRPLPQKSNKEEPSLDNYEFVLDTNKQNTLSQRKDNNDNSQNDDILDLDEPDATTQSSLTGIESFLMCQRCQTHLCLTSAIVSKGFTGRHGRAYLITKLHASNIVHQKPTVRTLQTGAHTVSDVNCAICRITLGWQYLAAEDRTQRYKVGKYILETGRVVKVNWWEAGKGDDVDESHKSAPEPAIEVNLDDEDELEDLFSGSWDADRVAKRRERRRRELESRREKELRRDGR